MPRDGPPCGEDRVGSWKSTDRSENQRPHRKGRRSGRFEYADPVRPDVSARSHDRRDRKPNRNDPTLTDRPTDRHPAAATAVGQAVPRPPLTASPGYRGSRARGGGRGRGSRTTSSYRYRYGYDAGRVRFARPTYYPYRHVRYPRYARPSVYGSFFYFPGYSFNLGVGFGYPGAFANYGYSGYAYRPSGYVDYTYRSSYVQPYSGALRLKVKPRDAQVFVDGYYVGLVDHFDGFSQRLRLEEGTYRIEIRHPEYLPIELDVLIVGDETVTFEDYMVRP